MQHKVSQVGSATIEYFVHGAHPKLLIHSGIHGDEHEVIRSVEHAVETYKERLPDFIFVPRVSPSAVIQRTRTNKNGLDLNRQFFPESREDEVLANMQIVRGSHFELLVSFHEDREYSQFYMYDSGIFVGHPTWEKARDRVRSCGVSLLNGLDDAGDPTLGYEFIDGYGHCPLPEEGTDGSFEYWAQREGIVDHWIMPEVPTAIKTRLKDEIVTNILEHLVLANFSDLEDAPKRDTIGACLPSSMAMTV